MDINRREVLKGFVSAGGAVIMGHHSITPAFAKASEIPEGGRFNALGTAVNRLARTNDVIILGDHNHDNLSLRAPLNDPAFLKSVRAAGVTDVYLETDPRLEPPFKKYMRGEIPLSEVMAEAKNNFKKDLMEGDARGLNHTNIYNQRNLTSDNLDVNTIEEVLKNAEAINRAGMRVHFIDLQDPVEIHQTLIALRDPDRSIEEKGQVFQKRFEHDDAIASHIQKTTEGKALVFYGHIHASLKAPGNASSQPHNIDDALRERGIKTAHILITDKSAKQIESEFKGYALNPETKALLGSFSYGIEKPSAVYNPENNSLQNMEPGVLPFNLQAPMTKPQPHQP